jgi:formate hydrogenlyase subunit 3/multisubunit Na+/H+ antiporter MnhD subunit
LIELLFIAFLAALLFSAIAAWLVASNTRARRLPPLFLLGSALLGLAIAGECFLSGNTINLDFSNHLPFAFGFTVDRLSGFFLMLICGLAAPVSLFSSSYSEHYSKVAWKWYWSLVPLFILSMATVVAASTVFAFMLGWELMTLLSASS